MLHQDSLEDRTFTVKMLHQDSLEDRTFTVKMLHQQQKKRFELVPIFMSPFEEGMGILLCTCWSVGLPHLVQWITQDRFAPQISNLVGR